MKRGLCCFIALFIFFSGAEVFSATEPSIKLSAEKWNFGQLKEGEVVEKIFLVENTGDLDLLIESVLATCECVTMEISSYHISSQSSAELKVTYDTEGKSSGLDSKKIYITSNDPYNPRITITIEAIIVSGEGYFTEYPIEEGE